jgi:hypothetical protein
VHLPVPGAYFAGLPSGGNTSSTRVSRPKKYTKGEMITEMITSYHFLAVIIVFLNRCYNFFHFGVSVFYVVIFSFGLSFFSFSFLMLSFCFHFMSSFMNVTIYLIILVFTFVNILPPFNHC